MSRNQQTNDASLTDESTKIEEEGGMNNSGLDDGEAPKKLADEIEWLPIGVLEPDENQPRKYFDPKQIEQLAQSLESHGMIEAIIYREDNGQKIVVAGDRRLRAANIAGLDKVPCRKFNGDRSDAEEFGLIDNIERANLLPMEEALAVERLRQEKKYTQAELGQKLCKAQNTISEILKLAKLPEYIQQEALSGPGWSRATLLKLASIQDKDEQQAEFANIKESLGQKSDKSEKPISGDEPKAVPAKDSRPGKGKGCPRAFNTSRNITQKLQDHLKTVLAFNNKQKQHINEDDKKAFIDELDQLKTTIEQCLKEFSAQDVKDVKDSD